MRVSKFEIDSIINAIEQKLAIKKTDLYLFGSRTNEELKGGDIDLLLIFDDSECFKIISENKHEILINIKNRIGYQKIDLVLEEKYKVSGNAFVSMILDDAKLLKSWQ